MNDDVSKLVERLETAHKRTHDERFMLAASTIRALVAEIERLRAERDSFQRVGIAAEAKLREAAETMAPFRGVAAMLGSACQDDERRWPGATPMPTVGELRRIDAFRATMEKTDAQVS
jgi:hypothetical protein